MCSKADRIKVLENEITQLSTQIQAKKEELLQLRESNEPVDDDSLTNVEIGRFSRQIILPEIGVNGQIKLRNSKVLIVGAGGLGKQETEKKIQLQENTINIFSLIVRMSSGSVSVWSWSWSYWNC